MELSLNKRRKAKRKIKIKVDLSLPTELTYAIGKKCNIKSCWIDSGSPPTFYLLGQAFNVWLLADPWEISKSTRKTFNYEKPDSFIF